MYICRAFKNTRHIKYYEESLVTFVVFEYCGEHLC